MFMYLNIYIRNITKFTNDRSHNNRHGEKKVYRNVQLKRQYT